VSPCASSKMVAHSASEIVFTLSGFHCDFRICRTLVVRPSDTTLHWRDFEMPLSREDVRVAESADGC
jgi:hypothetical protein